LVTAIKVFELEALPAEPVIPGWEKLIDDLSDQRNLSLVSERKVKLS